MMREPTNEVWLCLLFAVVVVAFLTFFFFLLLHIISCAAAFVQFSELLLLRCFADVATAKISLNFLNYFFVLLLFLLA